MMSAGILIFAALALSQATVQSMKLAQANRETAVAQAAIRQAIEDIQAQEFSDIFALYNSVAADDPGGEVAPGRNFAVPGLMPRDDDADGMVGEVLLPEKADFLNSELMESYEDAAMGMPLDLNGDGVIDDEDHSGDYQVLPVRVRLEWAGKSGDRVLEVRTMVSER